MRTHQWKKVLGSTVGTAARTLSTDGSDAYMLAKDVLIRNFEPLGPLVRLRLEGLIENDSYEEELESLRGVAEAEMFALQLFPKSSIRGTIGACLQSLLSTDGRFAVERRGRP